MISKKLDTIFWKTPILRPAWKAHTQTVESDSLHNGRDTHVNDTGAPRWKGCSSTTLMITRTPLNRTQSLLDLKTTALPSGGPAQRAADQMADNLHPQIRLAEALTTEMLHGIIWNTERKGNKTEHGQGETTINSNFLPQVLLWVHNTEIFHPTLSPHCQFH